MNTARVLPLTAGTILLALAVGCDGGSTRATDAEGDPYVAPPTNRIDIPSAVRSNLGITFATVERRRVLEHVAHVRDLVDLPVA